MAAMSKFPWEMQTPDYSVDGFSISTPTLRITLGYAIYGQQVLVFSCLTTPAGKMPWRRYWAHRDQALDAANNLAAEAEHYMTEVLLLSVLPSEDLTLEDFVEHMGARLDGAMH